MERIYRDCCRAPAIYCPLDTYIHTYMTTHPTTTHTNDDGCTLFSFCHLTPLYCHTGSRHQASSMTHRESCFWALLPSVFLFFSSPTLFFFFFSLSPFFLFHDPCLLAKNYGLPTGRFMDYQHFHSMTGFIFMADTMLSHLGIWRQCGRFQIPSARANSLSLPLTLTLHPPSFMAALLPLLSTINYCTRLVVIIPKKWILRCHPNRCVITCLIWHHLHGHHSKK